jgi:hypothetical protein
MLVPPVSIHDENLIALQLVARGLENDPLAVWRPISLGVLAAVGELPDFSQMRGCLPWQPLRQPTSSKENV